MFILVGLVLVVLPVDKLSRRFRSPGVQREWKDWKVTAASRYLQNRNEEKVNSLVTIFSCLNGTL